MGDTITSTTTQSNPLQSTTQPNPKKRPFSAVGAEFIEKGWRLVNKDIKLNKEHPPAKVKELPMEEPMGMYYTQLFLLSHS